MSNGIVIERIGVPRGVNIMVDLRAGQDFRLLERGNWAFTRGFEDFLDELMNGRVRLWNWVSANLVFRFGNSD